jgi:hypothetical protein
MFLWTQCGEWTADESEGKKNNCEAPVRVKWLELSWPWR